MSCATVLASFDPPIKFGEHSKMQGSKANYQSEHIIPTSALHKKGRKGPRIKGAEGYSTPKALTWMVRDRQKASQEHKLLTNAMRKFSQANDLAGGRQAPLSEWLDKYQEGAEDALKNAKPKRKITNDKVDPDKLIKAAAKCIRAAAARAFARMRPPVKASTPLRNPWKATKDQRAAAQAAASRAARGRRR
jgi:hypothetical protein